MAAVNSEQYARISHYFLVYVQALRWAHHP